MSDSSNPPLPNPLRSVCTSNLPAILDQLGISLALDNPQVRKYPSTQGRAGWDCFRADFDTGTVWLAGVGSFSDWAVGSETEPTAVYSLTVALAGQGGGAASSDPQGIACGEVWVLPDLVEGSVVTLTDETPPTFAIYLPPVAS
jgi:hypothetical protein